MEFNQLLHLAGDEGVFESALLLAGEVNPRSLRVQLVRWVKAKKLYQLRRGLYAFAPPYQKKALHPFWVANQMVRGSYVSLQSALAHYGLIPENVPRVTSVGSGRPARWETPLGTFEFRQIKSAWLFGYRLLDLGGGQQAFVASAEKALLDLIHLTPDADSPNYLRELRLQNLERLNLEELQQLAKRMGSPKLKRAVRVVVELARAEAEEYETL
jgi:predicted transcriptional regulator of viral defense system